MVVRRRRLFVQQQQQRLFVGAVLHDGGVCSQVRDGDGCRGRGLLRGVVRALWGLRRAVQARRNQAVLVLRACDLREI